VASTTLINKLQVLTMVHSTPYIPQWLRKGNKVCVSKQTLILFSVGPYYVEVLCDVLPIVACHILLDRPWLFDSYVMHDGHANLSVLMLKGHSLTSGPLPPPKPLKIKLKKGSEKSLNMRETWVERAISKSKPLFALLIVESNIGEEVKPLYPLA